MCAGFGEVIAITFFVFRLKAFSIEIKQRFKHIYYDNTSSIGTCILISIDHITGGISLPIYVGVELAGSEF